jgi:hypothetical protein
MLVARVYFSCTHRIGDPLDQAQAWHQLVSPTALPGQLTLEQAKSDHDLTTVYLASQYISKQGRQATPKE